MLTLLLACGASSPTDVEESPCVRAPASFSVLSYNVHGLPPSVTGDDTVGRLAQIGPMLGAYDLVGLQESWDATNQATMESASGFSNRRWFSEALEDRVYGAGVSVLTNLGSTAYFEQHYSACYGVLDGASDCLASKGFQVLRVCLADGREVDWYNTHLEAGGGPEDDAARTAHVDELIASMNGRSAGRALIFTADTNLDIGDPEDLPLLTRLAEEAGLRDACEELGCAEPDHIDRVMVRDGEAVALVPEAWSRELHFVDAEGVDLSDHPAIAATVRWSER